MKFQQFLLLATATMAFFHQKNLCVIENSTSHTIILHNFSAHDKPIEVALQELQPHHKINEKLLGFTDCMAITYNGQQSVSIDNLDTKQNISITDDVLSPSNRTEEQLREFKKMISVLRRRETLVVNQKRSKGACSIIETPR